MREISPRENPCFCINLKRATNSITRLYDKKMESAGLTASQFSLLNDIRLLERCSKAELSEFAKLEKSTITRNLIILRDKGYVKDLSANGSRESQVSLTELGHNKIKESNALWKEAQAFILEKVGSEDILQLKRILKIIENELTI